MTFPPFPTHETGIEKLERLSEQIFVSASRQLTLETVSKMTADELEMSCTAIARLSISLAGALVAEHRELRAKYDKVASA